MHFAGFPSQSRSVAGSTIFLVIGCVHSPSTACALRPKMHAAMMCWLSASRLTTASPALQPARLRFSSSTPSGKRSPPVLVMSLRYVSTPLSKRYYSRANQIWHDLHEAEDKSSSSCGLCALGRGSGHLVARCFCTGPLERVSWHASSQQVWEMSERFFTCFPAMGGEEWGCGSGELKFDPHGSRIADVILF
eukprot:TRINITY_DN112389_c0_g1_i1.p2 TRINITY_DN112389_c0_g1~~TRINITY_DN112389_c0_g1_i1.p2  ORF type:complete len:192 (-),score=0.77 TRINITY_DN112389_c0_g1_i1:109-684(-)